jgi:two-component system chemotaxis response regulator CheY
MEGIEEILDEFFEETIELLDTVISDILTMEKTRDDEVVNRVYRAFHSIKGNSSMLGFDRLSVFAHKTEDLLSLVRNRELEVTKAIADLLLHVLDTMKLILADIRQGGDDSRDTMATMELMADIISSTRASGKETSTKKTPQEKTEEITKVPEKKEETPVAKQAGFQGVAPQEKDTAGFDLDLSPVMTAVPEQPMPTPPATRSRECTNRELQTRPLHDRSLKMLIVEDDFTSRQIMLGFLSQYGDCHMAKDGLEAIDAFSYSYECDPPQPYDLICMDINMPKMDGIRASKTIREIERGKGIAGAEYETAIIVVSAVDDTSTIIKACYECGANYYFVKPLDFKQMNRQLRKLKLVD